MKCFAYGFVEHMETMRTSFKLISMATRDNNEAKWSDWIITE